MATTSDPADPRLTRGADTEPVGQAEAYLVLSDEERAAGFVRPVRDTYRHLVCGTTTTMARSIAETYARDPHFYGRHLLRPLLDVAASGAGSDTTDAFALVMAELDRLREVVGESKPRVIADRDQPPGEGRVRS